MNKYFDVLRKVSLFHAVSNDEITSMLKCLNGILLNYNKHSMIMRAGKPATWVGIICEGEVQIVRDDVLGNRTILAWRGAGDIFAEAYACAQVEVMPVGVMAVSKCVIMKIDYRRIITTCPASCQFHNKMIENMLGILARKNMELNQKNEILAARGLREKLNAYLLDQARAAGRLDFSIPFNRQELADFLSVERSALSRELGNMQKQGLIRFHKNQFAILG